MADEYARQHAAEQFEAAIGALKRHFDNEDFDKALPICIKALEAQPDNEVARRCRVFALLNLSRWSDAFQCCEKYKSGEEAFAFERAYCLYRLNRFQEALDVLSTAGGGNGLEDRTKRLEAQVRYRMGDYKTCAEIYEGLYREDPSESGPLVCAMASHTSGERPRDAIALIKEAQEHLESSYEVCFNLACAYVDEDRLPEAEKQLQEAKRLCVDELLEGMDEAEAEKIEDHEELAAIHVQRACVLQRRDNLGDLEEATNLYNQVLRQRSGMTGEVDVTVLAVACNNVVALRSEGKSLFDSLKRINVASKESLDHKLTTKQTVEIAMNKCLLLLQARKLEDAKRELQRLSDAHPGHPRVAVLQAVIAEKDKKAKGSAQEVLQAYLAKHPASEEVLLCLAQIHEQHQRRQEASDVLSRLTEESRAQPKTLEAIVALHLRQKHPEKAVACLREAITFWNGQGDESSEGAFAAVLRIAGRVAAQVNDRAFAAETFQLYLEKVDGSNNDALCGLVQALASTDIDRAEEFAARLRVPEYGHLDAEELEAQPIPKVQKIKQAAAAVAAAAEDDGTSADPKAQAKSKSKKKKKIRYPKNFDPENPGPPPDPERWLPKQERSEYKKRMSKKNKGLLRGPQGAMPVDDVAFRNKGASTAQVEVAKDTTTGARRAQQGRNKKGKK